MPVLVFLSEDGHEVARYGDRTLAKYRALVSQLLFFCASDEVSRFADSQYQLANVASAFLWATSVLAPSTFGVRWLLGH